MSNKARALFYKWFLGSGTASGALDACFSPEWTDDFPSASIEVNVPEIGLVKREAASQRELCCLGGARIN